METMKTNNLNLIRITIKAKKIAKICGTTILHLINHNNRRIVKNNHKGYSNLSNIQDNKRKWQSK